MENLKETKIHIEIANQLSNMPNNDNRLRGYLAPDVVLKALINTNEKIKEIIEPNMSFRLQLSDFSLYEALMCIEPQDNFEWSNLIMIMRNTDFIFSGKGEKISDERRQHLRKCALE